MAQVRAIYYLDVLSSWCLIAEDALDRVRRDFGSKLAVEWRIAALRHPLGYTHEQLAWYYRRTDAVTGVRLNPAWLLGPEDGSHIPNLAAEAARALGCEDDRVRRALARETMLNGRRSCERDVAIDDPATEARIRDSVKAFEALHVGLRPTFALSNGIGDDTILSGCWRADTL